MTRSLPHPTFLVALAALVGSTACSSDAPAGSTTTEPEVLTCGDQHRADRFKLGAQAETPSGVTVTVDEATPVPPGVGKNEWTVTLTDAGGAPMAGVALGLELWMPDHRHHSTVKAVITDEGAGKYSLTPVQFTMDGFWQVKFHVPSGGDGGAEELATLELCVE